MHSEPPSATRFHDGHASIALAAGLWATTGLAGALAPESASATALAEARTLVGGLVLAVFVGLRSGAAPFVQVIGWPLVAASAALAVFQWAFFAGVRGVGSAVAAVVSAGVSPLASDFLAALRVRRLPRRWIVLGSVASGAALFSAVVRGAPGTFGGLLAAALSGIAYAVYAEIAARPVRGLAERVADPPARGQAASLALTALALLGAAAALAPAAASSVWSMTSARGAVVTAYLGIVATALPYAAFVRGLRRMAPADALAVLTFQPVAATLLGWFVLDERLDEPAALTTLAVLSVAALRTWRRSRDLTRTQEKTA